MQAAKVTVGPEQRLCRRLEQKKRSELIHQARYAGDQHNGSPIDEQPIKSRCPAAALTSAVVSPTEPACSILDEQATGFMTYCLQLVPVQILGPESLC